MIHEQLRALAGKLQAGPPAGADPVAYWYNLLLEAIDVAGLIVRSLDSADIHADAQALSNDLIVVTSATIDKLPNDDWGVKALASSVLPLVVPPAVTALVTQHAGNVDAFKQQYALPLFKAVEEFGHRGRVAMGEV